MKLLIACCNFATEEKTPYFNLRRVSLAKNPSTALSHELDVGVKKLKIFMLLKL